MKKLSLVLLLVLFGMASLMAQRTVSGIVIDETGEALIGANITVKGAEGVGTATDIDGNFSVTVPDGYNTLIFSYTGYETKEMALGATNTLGTITMSEGQVLNEVVVTGLGIKKEKKALGYAVTTIGSSDLELRPEADVARVLRGKVPGVDITQTSGIAGSGTNVIIRGYSSITGTNQPLFVVDGVPFNSETGSDRDFSTGGATASSRFLDLDPNNIKDVSILKGLSATVLYGEAGRNGVVLITTKNGDLSDLNKKMEVTVTQSFFVTDIASLPEDQDAYGNGWQNFASAAFSNWGAPFDQPNSNGLTDGTIAHPYDRDALNDVFPELIGARYSYEAYDNLEQFFSTGNSSNTSVNISSKVGKGTSVNASYGRTSDEGFVPTNEYERNNFCLWTRTELANGLIISSTFNYVTTDRAAPPASIIFSSNPVEASLFSNVLYTPRSVDLFGLAFEDPRDNSSIFYRGGNDIQHPLWTLNNTIDEETLRRFYGTINLEYQLTDWLKATYRLGLDSYTQNQEFQINKGGRQVPDGLYVTTERLNSITDHNFNLQYNYNINEDINIDGVVGVNTRQDINDFFGSRSTQQFLFNLFTHDNFINNNAFSAESEENTIGAYGTFSLGYKSFLYFNFQGRNDWTSTLERDNRSIFYPSASVSFIPTDAFDGLKNDNVLSYLKVRFGYGTSAGYPDPYQTRNVLGTATNAFISNGGDVLNLNFVDDNFGNPNLEPERHREFEFGIDARLFKNRIGVDLSLYDKESTDLIFPLSLDPSTGFTSTTINVAEVSNRGIELGLTFRPVQTKDWVWDINTNFTQNNNVIEQIGEGLDKFLIDGFTFAGNYAVPGEEYGVIWTDAVLRDDAGNPIIGANGVFQAAPDIAQTGNPNPDWNLNAGTTLSWKGITFRMLWNYQQGGDMYAGTPSTLLSRGILEETDFDRFVPVIVPGVLADGSPNNIQVTANQHYWRDLGVFIFENRIYDATHIRLREVSLAFNLPKEWLENSPLGNASLTFSGQNLWFDAFNFPDGANFDPEVASLGVGNGRGFDFVTGPTSKKYGASLRITF